MRHSWFIDLYLPARTTGRKCGEVEWKVKVTFGRIVCVNGGQELMIGKLNYKVKSYIICVAQQDT